MPTKRKRNDVSIKQKFEIIQLKEQGKSYKYIMEKFDIGKSTYYDILKNRSEIRKNFQELGQIANKTSRVRDGQFLQLEKALFEWLCHTRAQNIPVTEEMLRTKAINLVNLSKQKIYSEQPMTEANFKFYHDSENFQFSNSWMYGFRRRFGIKCLKISGESGSITQEMIYDCRQSVSTRLEGFTRENIYNCDETALFWKCIPNRTLHPKGLDLQGQKQPKDRVTALLCCNSTGTDLRKPLIIGKFKKPRCFKNIDLNSLCVTYEANKNAWMTGNIFQKWLVDFDNQMQLEKRKVALVLDGASSHCDIELQNVSLIFLKANTIAICQPLDQGIIQNVKLRYRHQILQKMINCYDLNQKFEINLKIAIEWLVLAWKGLKQSSIQGCFNKSQILPQFSDFTQDIDDNLDPTLDTLVPESGLWRKFKIGNSAMIIISKPKIINKTTMRNMQNFYYKIIKMLNKYKTTFSTRKKFPSKKALILSHKWQKQQNNIMTNSSKNCPRNLYQTQKNLSVHMNTKLFKKKRRK